MKILRPVHLINETIQQILLEDNISRFISLSSEMPWLLPQNNSLCVRPVSGVILSICADSLAATGSCLSKMAVSSFAGWATV